MKGKNQFKPNNKKSTTAELTLTSVVTGVILAVVFGAANAYLGLRVGMTVSASIPAAVVSMGVIRILLRRNSILESNLVQTIGSAGESLAAGTIFTLPALFLWAREGYAQKPSLLEITLIALIGGLLGVFFMIPLRKALIVKERDSLPYPEGCACAEVLMAGEKDSSRATTVFIGMGFAGLYKFIVDGLKLVSGEISIKIKGFAGEIGTQIYPAVMSVGYICGARISSFMFAGGIFSWLVLIPLIVLFGKSATLYPADVSISTLYQNGGASEIWSNYIRYIGAGALAAGGIISLIKSMPLIAKTFSGAIKNLKTSAPNSDDRKSRDINIKIVALSILALTILVWLIPAVPVNLIGAILIVVLGFFFATVSSRMVGLVGSSNNPVSGMAIATLLIATVVLKFVGNDGFSGMASAIAIGSIICIVSAIAGDTSQDLKTGYILGATPRKQQIGEIIGVVIASLAIGGTLYLLDYAWGFGSDELAAPQATLMKIIVEGVMGGNLPWGLVITGVFIAVAVEIIGIPVLPFAIGIYLPVHLTACIMVGGLIRLLVERSKKSDKEKRVTSGILFASGMIAGEGIVGILLALLAILGINNVIDLSGFIPTLIFEFGGTLMFAILILVVLKVTVFKKHTKT
ncbi:MAG: oligopeptide transporter, OPT family [Clostridia bacterium]|nr:oligopeptide transporter, OPT family [Clostridia bacterium]